MPPLCIFDAATSHSPAAHPPSFLPAHCHRQSAALSAPWRGPSSARPESSPPIRVIRILPHLPWRRSAMATTLTASASTAAATWALEPDATRATKSGAAGAADPVTRALEPNTTWATESHPIPPSSPIGRPTHSIRSPATNRLFAVVDRLPATYCPPEKVRDLKFGRVKWFDEC
jgi:hypothetical protein